VGAENDDLPGAGGAGDLGNNGGLEPGVGEL